MIDIDTIKKQVSDVISYSQSIENPQVDDLIDTWYRNKKPFINAFGGKLIVESKNIVSFPLDEETKSKKAEVFIDEISHTSRNWDLVNFLYENKNSFFKNEVSISSEYKGKKIPKGMKLVKAMKFFESNKERLNQMQIKASQLIQEDKVEGKLCISVHPLDFLSSSETTYNWRSCHSLDGEYRAGNLSYMTDKATIICYLKGEDNTILPNFGDTKWNSKKWRVLMFVSDNWDMIAAGRQYPFPSIEGTDIVYDKIIELLGLNRCYFTDLSDISSKDLISNDIFLREKYLLIRGELLPISDVIKDIEKHPLHYNDLLYSSCYEMRYGFKDEPWTIENIRPVIHIGNKVKCLHCGKEYITANGEDTMMCDDCEAKYGEAENDTFAYCDCCGTRFYRDMGEWVGDDLICPNCVENQCHVCANCGEIFYDDDIVWDEDTDSYYCKECMDVILNDHLYSEY